MLTIEASRRKVAALLASLAISALCLPAAAAEPTFPNKPIKWVVPFPPGGAVDAVARIVAQKLSENLGQPVMVDNRPGSGGLIGTDAVAKSTPDGYTLLINSTGLAVDKWFYPKVPYDTMRDLTPVVLLTTVPSVLVVHPSSPAKTVEQLVDMAKKKPGGYSYASAGKGTSLHLASALFAARAGIDLLHVPYKGSGAAASDLLAGRVDLMIDSVTAQQQNIKAGLVRPLAVTSKTPSALFPEVPPLATAAKLPGYEVVTWCGIFVAANTPPQIVKRLNAELNKAISSDDVRQSLARLGVQPEGGNEAVLAALLKSEIDRWAQVIPQNKMNAE